MRAPMKMYKLVIVLTACVYYTNALGAVPLPLSDSSSSEINPRRIPSTSTEYLLPRDTVPIRYDVHLTTQIDQNIFDFDGNVQIYIQAITQVDRIVIHKRQTTIDGISLIGLHPPVNNIFEEMGNILSLKDWTFNETTEFLTVPLNGDTLRMDQYYKLEINYRGTLRGSKAGNNQTDVGFYRSSYVNARNITTWLAATKFEPHDARHAFPCYDEPALKAKFNIKLTYGSASGYTAVSNMPIKTESISGAYKTTTFDESPKMSTYLIAFVVSDFEYVANLPEPITDKTKVLHRVFGTPTKQDQLNFTLEAGVKILDELDKYLNVKYIETMPKMDQIGLPDFASGAMENWGLVAYAESSFYYSPTTSSHTQKDRIAKVVAHEFAHQWFGNLVSPEWWKYIWLNEGFATVFEYLIPNIVYPEYQGLDYFTIQVCQRVMITDSVSDIRPMTFDAYSPTEVSALFDRMAYDKPGCVISMIMHAIGETAFKAGLTKYLTERREQEANPEHLFTALQTVARESSTIPPSMTINAVFGRWSTQRGFPILKVTFDSTSKAITLQQEAFLIDSLTDPEQLTWTIPYNFITNEELSSSNNEDTTTYGWLDTKEAILSPTAARNWTNADWVLFNKKLTGYYRVTYDTDNWNAIISYMAENSTTIHYLNRAQLLGDAMNIARGNRLSYSIPIRLARNMMKHETNYFTLTPFINDFNFLEQAIFETSSYSKLLQWGVEVLTAAYNHYTVSENVADNQYYDTITRYNLVNFLCRVGFSKCHEDTTDALIEYLKNNLTVSTYLKPAILQNGLRHANRTVFLQVWELIMASRTQADRSTFMSGLGLTNYAENIEFLLDSVLVENNTEYFNVLINYSANERNTILTTIASSKVTGFKRILEFLKTNEETIKSIYGNNIATVFGTLAGRTSTLATLTQLNELMALYKANDASSRFDGYKATAEQNIAWNEGAGRTIVEPLVNFYPEEPDAASSMFYSTIFVIVAVIFTRLMS